MSKLIIQSKDCPKMTIPEEMGHFVKIMEHGARVYGCDNWLEDSEVFSFKKTHLSMMRHLFQSAFATPSDMDERITMMEIYECVDQAMHLAKTYHREDAESREDLLTHLICRSQMTYVKIARGHYQ